MSPSGDFDRARSIVFGSRRSKLALWQTHEVARRLVEQHPQLSFSVSEFATQGDRQLDQPLPEIGGQGLFTAELDHALRDGKIDVAVHSLKDLPTEPEPDIAVMPVLHRADPRDILVAKHSRTFAELPAAAIVGTSSPRRTSQLLALRPDLTVQSVRGNVPTRIEKTQVGSYDAVVLAAAGVVRVEMTDAISDWFTLEQMLPAPGQGALAVTLRADDHGMINLMQALVEADSARCVAAERFFLSHLGGGCSLPIAAYGAVLENGNIELTGRVTSGDGTTMITETRSAADPRTVAETVAAAVLEQGARRLL